MQFEHPFYLRLLQQTALRDNGVLVRTRTAISILREYLLLLLYYYLVVPRRRQYILTGMMYCAVTSSIGPLASLL